MVLRVVYWDINVKWAHMSEHPEHAKVLGLDSSLCCERQRAVAATVVPRDNMAWMLMSRATSLGTVNLENMHNQ